ncbi:HAD family hydrolase [Streptomyces sp. NPDC003077]|uniref:HAD family hydrolase n=1 Tax=Streptomyces sp. NPDC003077 TaxID=3154443 RepID=UPI0033A818C3
MPINAVLWDVDDTLFDYTGSDRAGALRHFEAEGVLGRFGSAERAMEVWREAMEVNFGLFVAGELGFEEHRRERARMFLGERLSDDEADAWFGRYVARYEAAWALCPDAGPVLAELAPLVRQGVLSNASCRIQEQKLRALGIRDHFQTVLCADTLGHAKPAPEAFHAACDALGLPPEQVAYVGDHREMDGIGARDAGLRSIWIDRRGPAGTEREGRAAPRGVSRLGSLADLPELLRSTIGFGAPSPIG